MGTFLERLQTLGPQEEWERLDSGADDRLERFSRACPLYARLLEQNPDWVLWLESPENLRSSHSFHALLAEWNHLRETNQSPAREAAAYPGLLRRLRRKMSMRIAYRDVADVAPGAETVEDLTRLAEFCLRECLFIATALWGRRLGEPWDDTLDQPARFCVLGFGKFGGQELNFSSDIDLLYAYEGEGHTRRAGKVTSTSNAEHFQRLGETITQLLNERDGDGFLFRADIRLRPGGAMAPLVPSIQAVENYYAAAGQTWERLALLKARPVAGDFALGAELLETLQSFRYPRHPPPSLLGEVAAMKQRTEREVVGASALERDVKSGYGGIREIEFVAQALQLLHAGRFPFLQTHSTIEALNQLVRYRMLEGSDAAFLQDAYWFLRRVEHRVQMADEQQTHELPPEPAARANIAVSLGFPDLEAFDARLMGDRGRIRELYSTLFVGAAPAAASATDDWWAFVAEDRESVRVRERIVGWFGERPDAHDRLRQFIRESESKPLMRDQVSRFADLVPVLDRVMPRLAQPLETIARISGFGERYASRSQFLAACTMNPVFFEMISLLFDRSRFIHELLSQHPEILDEVLRPEILRKAKDVAARQRELAAHPGLPAGEFDAWLWLYVRAEQVRAAAGHLLGHLEDEEAGRELANLAESVVLDLASREEGAPDLLVVALGQLGGGQLTFGSDLDLVFIAGDDTAMRAEASVRSLLKHLAASTARDAAFPVDLRLRPHGESGPLVPTVGSFSKYYTAAARPWERMALARARVMGGPGKLAERWNDFVAETVYGRPLTTGEADEIWRLRLRVENERDVVEPPERAFKTGAGGLVDVEFAAQLLQLRYGHEFPAVRVVSPAGAWNAIAAAGLADAAAVGRILENHRRLKRIEWALRRDANRGITVIPDTDRARRSLAKWLGAASWADFYEDHRSRMAETRHLIIGALRGLVSSTALEPDR